MKQNYFLFLIVALACTSCRFVERNQIKGNGNLSKVQRSVSGFTGVETNGSIDVVVNPGDFKVVVESDENIIPHILTEVIDHVLVVHFKNEMTGFNYTSAKVYVTAPSLDFFKSSGSGNIISQGTFSENGDAKVQVGGSGDVKVAVNCPAIDVEINGSGNITLAGQTKNFVSEINGSGDVRAFDLRTENANTTVHGSGTTQIAASVKLEAEIYGSGDVHYKGSPQVNSSVHGSGTVSPAN